MLAAPPLTVALDPEFPRVVAYTVGGDVLVCEARCAGDAAWQRLATFPRAKFPGAPAAVRLGKTHAVEALDDHSDLGPIGTTRYGLFRAYAR